MVLVVLLEFFSRRGLSYSTGIIPPTILVLVSRNVENHDMTGGTLFSGGDCPFIFSILMVQVFCRARY